MVSGYVHAYRDDDQTNKANPGVAANGGADAVPEHVVPPKRTTTGVTDQQKSDYCHHHEKEKPRSDRPGIPKASL